MNNKGMTIVELIVTFSLLLVIVIGMFNLIMDVKVELDSKQIAKDFTEYSSTINNQIHHDLINNTPDAISYKNSSSEDWKCIPKTVENCETLSSILSGLCKNIYPCAIIGYLSSSNDITGGTQSPYENEYTKAITLNINPSGETNTKYGIYYDNVFEPIPDQEYVNIGNAVNVGDDNTTYSSPKIDYDDTSKLFIIDFPYYMVDNDKNYGFKIVYPFGK